MAAAQHTPPDLLTVAMIAARTGRHRTTIWRDVKAGRFPAADYYLSPVSPVWTQATYDRWLASRAVKPAKPAAPAVPFRAEPVAAAPALTADQIEALGSALDVDATIAGLLAVAGFTTPLSILNADLGAIADIDGFDHDFAAEIQERARGAVRHAARAHFANAREGAP